MKAPVCQTCTHYRRHYLLDVQSAIPTNCGHCVYPSLKHRKPDTPACGHYQFRITPPELPDRSKVIHYMTTEFLQYILSLELPPEISAQQMCKFFDRG